MPALLDSHISELVRLFPCFSSVPREAWRLAELAPVTPDTPHTIREGHMLQHAMFVVSGSIRIYKISPAGREITLYRVRGGQSCVLMMASILGEMEYEASASIETEAEVLLLPVDVFKHWMDLYAPLRQYIYKQIVERMTSVTQLLENVAFQPIPYRIAEYLWLQSAHADSLQLTHEQLAIELGTSREVVTRTLRSFASDGVVALSRGRIGIPKRDALLKIIERHS
ncbi:Crp/Fnr family transcriptional regulator [Paenibacillus sp. NEAU-GSW1]|uniref:Crp/Fnr family transcriptional regulator n=1 Tax=Paenibacillus sp. NEAU-GSW1 TaxID=2682486 RepID=UPI0012E1BE57|nr:Crp/Fnr family transcriptional regulator [Paenibacillus sp. NEAU-GSW1]MUT64812.1 helix-turn-helix domain-containing protein [Paenibacillus sp. NEAU-GSW1]